MKISQAWRMRVDIRSVLQESGFEVVTVSPTRMALRCPWHDGDGDLIVSADASQGHELTDPGKWWCSTCKISGHIENLLAKKSGETEKQTREGLIKRFAADLVPGRLARRLGVSEDAVATWHRELLDNPAARDALHAVGVSDAVIERARVGIDPEGSLSFPVSGMDGDLTAVITMTKTGVLGVVHGQHVYPRSLIDPKTRVVALVAGAIEALVLHSMGINYAAAILPMNAMFKPESLAEFFPKGPGSTVTVCLPSEGSKRLRYVSARLLGYGTERVLTCPPMPNAHATLHGYLATLPEEMRRAAWDKLVTEATIRGEGAANFGGILEDGRKLTNDDGEVIANWTGRVVSSGIERFGWDVAPKRVFTLDLRHVNGDTLTVQHRYGDNFAQSILTAPGSGPHWSIAQNKADNVLAWLANASDGVDNKDTGWVFGWDPLKANTFYSRSTAFTPKGAVENTEIRMVAPASVLDRIDVPAPDTERGSEGLHVLWRALVRSHLPVVTYPMLSVFLLAPVRRLYFPNLPRFGTMVVGMSGCGKTTLCRNLQGLYGSFQTDNSLLSWTATIKSIDTVIGHAGDMAMVIDEFPTAKRLDDQQYKEYLNYLMSVAQGAGRYKLNRESKLVTPPEPRSLIVVTSEESIVSDEAIASRMLTVKVPIMNFAIGSPFKESCVETLSRAEMLPHAMSAWIDYALRNPEMWLEHADDMAMRTEVAFGQYDHKWAINTNVVRVFERIKTLSHVWRVFLAMLRAHTIIGDAELNEALERWFHDAVPMAFEATSDSVESGRREINFFEELGMRLQSGEAVIRSESGGKSIPSYASNTAKVVGHYEMARPPGPCISYRGQSIAVSLYSSAAAQQGNYDVRGARWKQIVSVLKLREMVVQHTRRDGRTVLQLSEEGMRCLLEHIPGTSFQAALPDQT